MKLKSKKSALILSCASLIVCFAMLVGSTFAWFTDTATASVNTIQSGKLDVDIVDTSDDHNSLEGTALQWTQMTSAGGELVTVDPGNENLPLWEPNCTFKTIGFQIANKGNLWLKYKIALNGVTGDADLLKVIKFSVVNAGGSPVDLSSFEGDLAPKAMSEVLYIQGYMDQNAGNEYQEKTLENISIVVTATQKDAEFDSINNIYDEGATYPVELTASSKDEFNNALTLVNKGSGTESKNVKITLSDDISDANGIQTKAGKNLLVDFAGKIVEISNSTGSLNPPSCGAQFLKGSNVTLKNGTYKFAATKGTEQILIQNYANLTLDGVTLNDSEVPYALSTNCGVVTIKGNTNITVKSGGTALDIMHWENASYKEEGSHVVIDESMTGTIDGKIDVYCYDGSIRDVDDGGATLVIKGGTFKNSGLNLEQFKAFVPAGYKVTETETGVFTVTH